MKVGADIIRPLIVYLLVFFVAQLYNFSNVTERNIAVTVRCLCI